MRWSWHHTEPIPAWLWCCRLKYRYWTALVRRSWSTALRATPWQTPTQCSISRKQQSRQVSSCGFPWFSWNRWNNMSAHLRKYNSFTYSHENVKKKICLVFDSHKHRHVVYNSQLAFIKRFYYFSIGRRTACFPRTRHRRYPVGQPARWRSCHDQSLRLAVCCLCAHVRQRVFALVWHFCRWLLQWAECWRYYRCALNAGAQIMWIVSHRCKTHHLVCKKNMEYVCIGLLWNNVQYFCTVVYIHSFNYLYSPQHDVFVI